MIFGGCTQSLAMLSSIEGIEASQQIAHELRADQNHRFHVRPAKMVPSLVASRTTCIKPCEQVSDAQALETSEHVD